MTSDPCGSSARSSRWGSLNEAVITDKQPDLVVTLQHYRLTRATISDFWAVGTSGDFARSSNVGTISRRSTVTPVFVELHLGLGR